MDGRRGRVDHDGRPRRSAELAAGRAAPGRCAPVGHALRARRRTGRHTGQQPDSQRALRMGPCECAARRAPADPALAAVRLHGRPGRLRRRIGGFASPVRVRDTGARRCPRARSDDAHGLSVDDRRDLPGHRVVARRDRWSPARRAWSALGRGGRQDQLRFRRLAQLVRSDGPVQSARPRSA